MRNFLFEHFATVKGAGRLEGRRGEGVVGMGMRRDYGDGQPDYFARGRGRGNIRHVSQAARGNKEGETEKEKGGEGSGERGRGGPKTQATNYLTVRRKDEDADVME